MGEWLAKRIIVGALTYADIIAKYPQVKEDIDKYLTGYGKQDLIK